MASAKYYQDDQTPDVPAPGGSAGPDGYAAPTPHAAAKEQRPYHAPSSLPTGNPAPEAHGAWDFADHPRQPTKPGH